MWDIVEDLAGHAELAGSGEVLKIRKLTEGPVSLGTMIEADEAIQLGDQLWEFAAKSVVVGYDAPRSISWIPVPDLPMPIRRIQWWFHLTPQGAGTHVAHEVEVELAEQTDPDLKAFKDNYEQVRGVTVAAGMEKTLENLRRKAEARAGG